MKEGSKYQPLLDYLRQNSQAIALICSRSVTTVRRWFARGERHRHPQPHDLRHLALMNFLLEHFEAIPPELRQQRKLTQFVILSGLTQRNRVSTKNLRLGTKDRSKKPGFWVRRA